MRTSSPWLSSMLLVAALQLLAGCGSDAATPSRPPPRSLPPATAPHVALERSTCAAPPQVPAGRPSTTAARDIVDRAAGRAAARARKFTTRLQLSTANGLRARAVMIGSRGADGSSSARLRWQGPESLLLPDMTLRIVDDQLALRTERDTAFRQLGSASGVSLDVGRELLAHPFLLEPRAARGTLDDLALTLDAPRDELRSYAVTERRGPITELLRDVEHLQITPRVIDGTLVADRFMLRTRVPKSFTEIAPLHDVVVTLAGVTTTCEL